MPHHFSLPREQQQELLHQLNTMHLLMFILHSTQPYIEMHLPCTDSLPQITLHNIFKGTYNTFIQYSQMLRVVQKFMAPHSSTLAWKIPWTEQPGRLQSLGSLSRTSLSNFTFIFTFMHWIRKWQPTPVFLPGESQGRGSLVGYRLWGRTESDMTEANQHQQQQKFINYPSFIFFFSLFRHMHPLELTSHHFCIFCISLPATKRLKKD